MFDEELTIYQGLLHSRSKIRAWVEFSCDELRQPVNSQGFQDNNESYLSVKLSASFDVSVRNGDDKKSSSSTEEKKASLNLGLCVNKMKLSYYNETANEIIK